MQLSFILKPNKVVDRGEGDGDMTQTSFDIGISSDASNMAFGRSFESLPGKRVTVIEEVFFIFLACDS